MKMEGHFDEVSSRGTMSLHSLFPWVRANGGDRISGW